MLPVAGAKHHAATDDCCWEGPEIWWPLVSVDNCERCRLDLHRQPGRRRK